MPEGDGVDEVLDGAKRVVLTGAGQVLENLARRREDEARQRAASAGAQAAADRQRGEALAAVRDVPTAVAVLAADDRRQVSTVAAGVPAVQVLVADPESRVRGLEVDKEGIEAAVLAGRSQAKPAAEAVREQGSAGKGRAPKARGRGRGAERERGR